MSLPSQTNRDKDFEINNLPLGTCLLLSKRGCCAKEVGPEDGMEFLTTAITVIGGLTFSLAASLLIEELIFGRIVRVAFARRPETPKRFSEHEPKN